MLATGRGTEYKDIADEEIIRRVIAGEHDLFEVLVRRYSQRLYRVAVAVLRNPDDAEDVMQETFVSAFKHLRQFAGRSKFVSWLTRIALNNALYRVKSAGRYLSIDDVAISESAPLASRADDPERSVSKSERARMVRQAVAALPEHFRDILVLRDLQELDTDTTAARLGISPENVKVRLHRARRTLGKRLVALQCNASQPLVLSRCANSQSPTASLAASARCR